VPSPGAFSNHFLQDMKQIYELKPFIDVQVTEVKESSPSRKNGFLTRAANLRDINVSIFTPYYEIEPKEDIKMNDPLLKVSICKGI